MQDFYLDWGRVENEPIIDNYIDPMSVPFIAEFQKGLEFIHESEELLINKLEENLSILEKMAAEIFRVVSARLNGTPTDLPVDPYLLSLKLSNKELIEQGMSNNALSPEPEMAKAISILWLKGKGCVLIQFLKKKRIFLHRKFATR